MATIFLTRTPLLVHAGEPFDLGFGSGSPQWSAQFVLDTPMGSSVQLHGTLKHRDEIVGAPTLMLAMGQAGDISLADRHNAPIELHVSVTPAALSQ